MALPRRNMTKEELVKDFRTSEIADAARRVIGKLGYVDASMEQIAQEAGVSKGTLYLYFRSKEELLGRAFELGFSELMSRTRSGVSRARGYEPKLREVVRAFLEHAAEQRAFLQGLRGSVEPRMDTRSELMEQIWAQEDAYVRFLAGLLARGARSGEFRALPADRSARFLLEVLRGAMIFRLRASSPPPVEEDLDAIVDVFLHGIGTGESK